MARCVVVVLSVANSKVVKAVDGYPDLEPGVLDPT